MIVGVLLLSLLTPSVSWSEGLRFVNGRLDAGPVTVLDLNESQLLQVRTKRIVVLTPMRQKEIHHGGTETRRRPRFPRGKSATENLIFNGVVFLNLQLSKFLVFSVPPCLRGEVLLSHQG